VHIWLNGQLLPTAAARLDAADRGLLLGDGLFETMRVVEGRPPLLSRHLTRLNEGARVLGLPVPAVDMEAVLRQLLTANGLRQAAVRLTLTRGPGPRGLLPPAELAPTLLITASPLPPAPEPIRAVVATVTRRNELSPLSRIKALGYLDQILALREAQARGAEEALMLNTAGRLACGTTANLFLVHDAALLTPPLEEGALPGITRALVLELAPGLGIAACETPLEPAMLAHAQEAFLTSSLRFLTPLASIEDRPLPAPGKLARAVTAALRRAASP
jgi:branched-chain amino acid aminotransferase